MIIQNNKPEKVRADVLLAEANMSYSRAALAKLFNMGRITHNGKTVKAGDKIQPDKSIEADLSALEKPAEDLILPILFEDQNVVVINKPVGVISHARGRYWDEASVASFLRTKVVGLDGERAGIVHRLDRATSGVMICAKNSATLSYLQKQFNNRTVKKHYKAIISGQLKPSRGIIDVPIARNPKAPTAFIADAAGKSSQTEYDIDKHSDKYSLLNLHPLTGRTHQLRVHLKFMKHPIVGDTLYDGEASNRLMLHAYSLEITIPGGLRKVFIAKTPDEFKKHF